MHCSIFKKTALLQGNHCACRSAKRLLYPNKNPYFTLNKRIFSVCSTVTNLLQAAIFLLFFTKIKLDKVGLKVVVTECSWHKIGLGAGRSTSIQWPPQFNGHMLTTKSQGGYMTFLSFCFLT